MISFHFLLLPSRTVDTSKKSESLYSGRLICVTWMRGNKKKRQNKTENRKSALLPSTFSFSFCNWRKSGKILSENVREKVKMLSTSWKLIAQLKWIYKNAANEFHIYLFISFGEENKFILFLVYCFFIFFFCIIVMQSRLKLSLNHCGTGNECQTIALSLIVINIVLKP